MTPFAAHSHPEDVYDEAMTERPNVGYGKVTAEVYRVVLIKGRGKVAYDPNDAAQNGLRPSVAIDFKITPLDATRPIMALKTMLDWTREFTQVVRPSLQRLAPQLAAIRNVDPEDKNFNVLREVQGLFVRYQWVPRPDNKAGETWTTICFTDVYPDETRCKDAAAKELGGQPSLDDTVPFPSDTGDQEAKERDALAAFLLPLWMQSGQDRDKFLAQIKQPPYSKFFNENSEEVKKVMVPF